MNKIFFLFILSAICSQYAYSQSFSPEVIASAGDISEGTSVTLCWTLGETVTETLQPPSLKVILTQGFWQADMHTTGIDKLSDLSQLINLTVFPNPASDLIYLEGELDTPEEIDISLFDSQGRKLFSQQNMLGDGNRIEFPLSAFAKGTYFLVVRAASLHAQSSFSLVKR